MKCYSTQEFVGMSFQMFLISIVFLECFAAETTATTTVSPKILSVDEFQNFTITNRSDSELQLSFTRQLYLTNRTHTNGTRSHLALLQAREKSKQERLLLIRSQILSRLGVNQRNNSAFNGSSLSQKDQQLLTEVYTRLTNQGSGISVAGNQADIVFQRLQSFHSSCKVPFQSDPSRWVGEADNELKLYFDLNFTRPGITQSEILVILGKLMLFHEDSPVLSGKSPGSDVNRDESNNGTRNELNLTVFQFLKPLKRNRKEKRKKIDRKTVSPGHKGWIEFDISSCVLHWTQHPTKNFGLEIEVTDYLGNKLAAKQFVKSLNCSGLFAEPVGDRGMLPQIETRSESTVSSASRYPTLDLVIVESRPRKAEE